MAAFDRCVSTIEELRELIPPPEATAIEKEVDHLDVHCRDFIARSPFLVIASAGADGRIDASPRGGPPGFVQTLDERRLAVPDYPGNRRLDSWQNVIATGHVQLIFFIPGMLEALRISGRAVLTRDPAVLARCLDRGRTPALALGVEVEVAYLQCGKALRRSQLWEPASWPAKDALPSAPRIFIDHVGRPEISEKAAARHLAKDYEQGLWPTGESES